MQEYGTAVGNAYIQSTHAMELAMKNYGTVVGYVYIRVDNAMEHAQMDGSKEHMMNVILSKFEISI